MQPPHSQHALSPLFGTRCRSQGFACLHPSAGTDQYIHFIAFRDTANRDSWTVQRVTQTGNSKTGETWAKVEAMGQHIRFYDALALIGQLEKHHRDSPQNFRPLFPDAAALGFDHFRAFAEREGYVFDRDGKAHPRPAHGLLPADCIVSTDAIASADRHCQRPAGEFGPEAASRRLPDTLFLFDAFNRKAIGKKQGNELAGLRVLNLMDTFVRHIDAFDTHLHEYRAGYLSPGSGGRIAAAELSLQQANNQLRQISAYGVDTSVFEKLATECAILACVAHAQGTYEQLRRQMGDFQELETLFKSRAGEAMRIYEASEKNDPAKDKETATRYADGYAALQEMMIQGGPPAIPPAIRQFVERYREQRARMLANPPADASQPTAPKPPAP